LVGTVDGQDLQGQLTQDVCQALPERFLTDDLFAAWMRVEIVGELEVLASRQKAPGKAEFSAIADRHGPKYTADNVKKIWQRAIKKIDKDLFEYLGIPGIEPIDDIHLEALATEWSVPLHTLHRLRNKRKVKVGNEPTSNR
jgi:hypothetical protein